MIDLYKSAKEHKTKLIDDQARLTEKLTTIWNNVIRCRAEKEQAIFQLEQCEKQYIRDQITADDLEVVREASKKAVEKQASAERLHGLAVDELERLGRDLLKAQENIISSSRRFSTAERGSLSSAINQDTKVRQRILEAYSANLIETNWANLSWPHFLGSIFKAPTTEEAKESVLKFKQKHGLD